MEVTWVLPSCSEDGLRGAWWESWRAPWSYEELVAQSRPAEPLEVESNLRHFYTYWSLEQTSFIEIGLLKVQTSIFHLPIKSPMLKLLPVTIVAETFSHYFPHEAPCARCELASPWEAGGVVHSVEHGHRWGNFYQTSRFYTNNCLATVQVCYC